MTSTSNWTQKQTGNSKADVTVELYAPYNQPQDKNGRDLTEAEDIKNWWQDYTEEL